MIENYIHYVFAFEFNHVGFIILYEQVKNPFPSEGNIIGFNSTNSGSRQAYIYRLRF